MAERPPDYFDAANQVLLGCLCHSIAAADLIWAEVNSLGSINVANKAQYAQWRRLLVMAARETRSQLGLTTKLRLLPTKAAAERAERAWTAQVSGRPLWKGIP